MATWPIRFHCIFQHSMVNLSSPNYYWNLVNIVMSPPLGTYGFGLSVRLSVHLPLVVDGFSGAYKKNTGSVVLSHGKHFLWVSWPLLISVLTENVWPSVDRNRVCWGNLGGGILSPFLDKVWFRWYLEYIFSQSVMSLNPGSSDYND